MAKAWKCYIEWGALSKDVLKGDAMQQVLKDEAEKIVGRAGEGYGYNVRLYGTRAVANVAPTTPRAYNSNLKHNTLLKALGGGR